MRRKLVCTSVFLSFLLVAVVGVAKADAAPEHKRVDRAVRQSVQSGRRTQRVIITVNPGCRAAVRDALKKHGDTVDSEQGLIDAVSGELHSPDVDVLADSPCVRGISSDADVHAIGSWADTAADAAGKLHRLSRREAAAAAALAQQPSQLLSNSLRDTLGLPHVAALNPSVPTGGGVGVAVIDSGIAPGLDFAGRITAFYDFTQGGRASYPYDDYGHGTHIAGLIGSSGVLSNSQYQGVAPEVRLVGLKVLDRSGTGRTSDVINAIEFVVANRVALNVQIINISLGHPIYAPAADDPLVQAVEKASAAGLIVVTSAGNFGLKQTDGSSGYAGITSPGNAPSSITVGAAMTQDTTTRSDDEVAPYSSRGPSWFDAFVKPDVLAPGHRLDPTPISRRTSTNS